MKRGSAIPTSSTRSACCRRSRTMWSTRLEYSGPQRGRPVDLGYSRCFLRLGTNGNNARTIWSGFGDRGGDGPYVVTDPTWQIVDNVSLGKGQAFAAARLRIQPADLQPAGQSVLARSIQLSAACYGASIGHTGNATLSGGDALADFLLGNLYQSTVAVAVANANYVRNVEGVLRRRHLQDSRRISPFPRASGTN